MPNPSSSASSSRNQVLFRTLSASTGAESRPTSDGRNGLRSASSDASLPTWDGVELYVMEDNEVLPVQQGSLNLQESRLGGYRATFRPRQQPQEEERQAGASEGERASTVKVPDRDGMRTQQQDAGPSREQADAAAGVGATAGAAAAGATSSSSASLSWTLPDALLVLRVGAATYVVPRSAVQRTYHILNFPDTSARQLRRFELALERRCCVFAVQGGEDGLTAQEWEAQLRMLQRNAQYNSRVARSVSNLGLQLSHGISSSRPALTAALSLGRDKALSTLRPERVAVDQETRMLVHGAAAAGRTTHRTVQAALDLVAKPVADGLKAGITGGKEAFAMLREAFAEEQHKSGRRGPAPPPRRSPGQGMELFRAFTGAVGDVLSAAVSSGKEVAAAGGSAMQEVITHRYGPEVAQLSSDGLAAAVSVARTVGAIKTFGAISFARHTAKGAARGYLAGTNGGQPADDVSGARVVSVSLAVDPGSGEVTVHIAPYQRLVAVQLLPRTQLAGTRRPVGASNTIKVCIQVLDRQPDSKASTPTSSAAAAAGAGADRGDSRHMAVRQLVRWASLTQENVDAGDGDGNGGGSGSRSSNVVERRKSRGEQLRRGGSMPELVAMRSGVFLPPQCTSPAC